MPSCTCRCCERARERAAHANTLTNIFLDRELSLYQTFANGMHALGAYKRARAQRWPIPEWVLTYFDEAYAKLREKGGTARPEMVAEAFKLHTAKGGKSARERAVAQRRYMGVIAAVHERQRQVSPGRRRQARTIDDVIFSDVSGQFGLSPARVRNIYYEFTARPVKTRKPARKS
jgi:hypothetical protein